MASPFPTARAEVDYPLYAVDFDPEDATRIVVGGGGGAGRSGVANKIVCSLDFVLELQNQKTMLTRYFNNTDCSRTYRCRRSTQGRRAQPFSRRR